MSTAYCETAYVESSYANTGDILMSHQRQEGTEIQGNSVALLVNVGTRENPEWMVVASQQGLSIDSSTDQISVSSKRSRSPSHHVGSKTQTISLESVFVPDTLANAYIEEADEYGERVMVREMIDEQHIRQSSGIITSLSDSHPVNEGSTRTIELAIDKWEYV